MDSGSSTALAQADGRPTTALWLGDRLAAQSLYSQNANLASQEADDLACALATPGRKAAALVLVGSSLAVAKVQESALAGLLAVLITKRNLKTAREMSLLLRHASERVAVLAKAHAALDPQPRCTVLVATGSSGVMVGVTEEQA